MEEIIYEYINHESEIFKQAIDLRYKILFEPYSRIKKYEYDEIDPISLHLIALDKDTVAGYSRMTNVNGKGEITNVVVNPTYINQGIGFKMMKSHISKAKEYNMTLLYLHARLETVDFYKKVGFECKDKINVSKKSGLPLQNMYLKL